MKNVLVIKLAISIIPLVGIMVRILWPDLRIDAFTLGLLSLLILPWFTSIVESAGLSGGWKVKFRDVQAAGEAITNSVSIGNANEHFIIGTGDPNLALVALRIEIDKRLRALTEKYGLRDRGTAKRHLEDLQKAGKLDPAKIDGLQRLIGLANRAVHGAEVEPEVADGRLRTDLGFFEHSTMQ